LAGTVYRLPAKVKTTLSPWIVGKRKRRASSEAGCGVAVPARRRNDRRIKRERMRR
jgi:hypothetical protein